MVKFCFNDLIVDKFIWSILNYVPEKIYQYREMPKCKCRKVKS